ncbi:MAG: hypothetical protein ACLQOO_31835 [Terriglobia bacterium]
MEFWRPFVHHGLGVFDLVIIFYFLVGNGVYSLLMGISLVRTSIVNFPPRRRSHIVNNWTKPLAR